MDAAAPGYEHIDVPELLPLVSAGTPAAELADRFATLFFVGRAYAGDLALSTSRPPLALGIYGPQGPPIVKLAPLEDGTIYIEGVARVGIQACDDNADGEPAVADILTSAAGDLGTDFPICDSSGFEANFTGLYGMDGPSSTFDVELPVAITFWDDRPGHYAGLTPATIDLTLDNDAITGSVRLGTEEYSWRATAEGSGRQLLVVNDGPFEELLVNDDVIYARAGSTVHRLAPDGSSAWERDMATEFGDMRGTGAFLVLAPLLGEGGVPQGDLVVIDTDTGDVAYLGSPPDEKWLIRDVTTLEDGPSLLLVEAGDGAGDATLLGLELPELKEIWRTRLSGSQRAVFVGDEIWTYNDHGFSTTILSATDGTQLGQPFYGSTDTVTFTGPGLVGSWPDRETLRLVETSTGAIVVTLDPGYGTEIRTEGVSWQPGFADVIEYDGRWWTNYRLNYENGRRPSWVSEYELDGTRLETSEACQGSFRVTELGLFHGPTMIASTNSLITPPGLPNDGGCPERADQDIQSEVVHPESGMWGLRSDGSLVRFGIGPGFLQIPPRPT